MKKLLPVVAVFLLFMNAVFAGPVDKKLAREVAQNHYWQHVQQERQLDYDEILPVLTYTASVDGIDTYYVFNINANDGFVVVSADDAVYPVLGYSLSGSFNVDKIETATNVKAWLDHYTEQIAFAVKNQLTASSQTEEAWILLKDNSDIKSLQRSVDPLLATNWDQGCYYNEDCPDDNSGPCNHVYAGCVATTMGQVMKYHAHPEQGTGSHSYYHSTYGTLFANFGTATYDWVGMPNQIYSNDADIAELLYHCGVSVEMDYGPNGSGAYSADARDALVDYFSYSADAYFAWKNNYNSTTWENMLKDNLDNGYPIYYRGQNFAGTSGHAWVCDGYSGTNYFHFNWGWSGSYNGYFYLTSLTPGSSNFSYSQGGIIDLYPDQTLYVPSNLQATQSGNDVILSWDAPSTKDLNGYNVYRDNTQCNSSLVTSQSYTDEDLSSGTYVYTVTAVYDAGESDPCAPLSFTVVDLLPPNNLTADVNMNTVTLNWQPPDAGGGEWLHYDDGENGNSIGLTDGGTFSVAIRFAPDQLEGYGGMYLSKIKFFPAAASPTFDLKVWKGANANTLVYQQTVDVFTVEEWNEIDLDTPVLVEEATELWFGYTVNNHAAGDFPAGTDAGPAVAGFGDMISLDGTTWVSMATAYGLDYNWNLQGYVENMDLEPTALKTLEKSTFENAGNTLATGGKIDSPKAKTTSINRGLLGYNAYRNDVKLNNPVITGLQYIDNNVPSGTHTYGVTAVYDEGESDPVTVNATVEGQIHFEFGGGNPADPIWTLYLAGATIPGDGDNVDLQPGDEIAIFDGETMVGAFVLDEVLTPANQFDNPLIAWSTLNNGNGYTPGNAVSFKCWDASEEEEIENAVISYSNPYGDAWTEPVFPDGDGQYSIASLEFGALHFQFEGGNPADPVWTAYLEEAMLDDVDLQPGDEIAMFDGETMVGAYQLDEVLTPENALDHPLILFSTLTSGNGYNPGNPITLKCWDASEELETAFFEVEFFNPYGDAWTEPFFPSGDGEYSIISIDFSSTYFDFEGGNPADPVWTLYLAEALLDEVNLQAGDEIAMFDGETMVGTYQLDEVLTPENALDHPLIAWSTLTSGDGYVPGNPITLKCYDLSEGLMTSFFDVEFHNPYGDAWTDPFFPEGDGEYSIVSIDYSSTYFNFEGGNPADPVWTIYLSGGTLDEVDLVAGDEIAIFDGETLVGAFQLDEVLTPENQFDNPLIAWSTLTSGDGYTPGNPISFKCYDLSEGLIVDFWDITFYDPYGDAWTDPYFPSEDGEYSLADLAFATIVEQSFSLGTGYQFVSSHIIPNDPDMMVVLEDILNSNLDFVRNTDGNMLRKIGPVWVNNIGDWMTKEGYLFKMNAGDSYTMQGDQMAYNEPIDLTAGYQFISYLIDYPVDAEVAMEGILNDNLDFVRNSSGNMLRKIGPVWVNNIGDLIPGEGYLVRMNNADELIYNTGTKSAVINPAPSHFAFEGGNAADPVYSMYLQGDLNPGDEVAAFDGDKMVGSTVITSEKALQNELPVFATLNSGEGYVAGNEIRLKVFDAETGEVNEVVPEFANPYGDAYMAATYPSSDGEYSVIRIKHSADVANSASIYPNPASDMLHVNTTAQMESIRILNYVGQEVYHNNATGSSVDIDLSGYNSGAYVIEIVTTDQQRISKRILIK